MLRYRSAHHNKRIRESNPLVKHSYLAELRLLKGVRDVNAESMDIPLTEKTGELELIITLVL